MKILSNSSQPYLFKKDNNYYMLYCGATNTISLTFGNTKYNVRPWKIYLYDLANDTTSIIRTPSYVDSYGQAIIECNPHIKVINNIIKLYYTVGFMQSEGQPILYHVCSMTASDLSFDSLSDFNIVYKTFTGTPINNNELLCIEKAYNTDLLIVKDLVNNTNTRIIENNFDMIEILRLTNIYNSDKFIITGKDNNYNYISYILNNNFSINKKLLNSFGKDVYKSTVLDNMLAFTVQNQSNDSNSVEDRAIVIENIDNN